jgi:hypothetical protein
MPGIDKKGFLSRLEKKASEYESPMPGEPPETEESEGVDCGALLLAGVKANDPEMINDAFREAAAKYGG